MTCRCCVFHVCCCRAATPTPSAADSPAAAAAAAVAAAAAAAASRGGPSWQQLALAQAGLLMLLDADFESGLSVLQELPLEVWQPSQLFSLFPKLMARSVEGAPGGGASLLSGLGGVGAVAAVTVVQPVPKLMAR